MGRLSDSISVTAIRNEGPFLLQWVAWQIALGFDRILVMHNDCTDHSPQLLRLLEREGVLLQKAHRPDPAKPPQPQAHMAASRHPALRSASWCFVSDVDERLVVHVGDGSVAALAAQIQGAAAGMAVNWRIFGTQGEDDWDDRILHRHYRRAARIGANQNTGIKTFFHRPADWERLRAHGPFGWRGAGAWGVGANRIIRADGTELADYSPDHRPANATQRADITHAAAQVNHYALQSREQFLMKRGVPCASTLNNRYTDDFFDRFDRNEEADDCATRYDPAFAAALETLMAIPGVARLHDLNCADFAAALARRAGRDPAQDARLCRFLDRAAAQPRHRAAGKDSRM